MIRTVYENVRKDFDEDKDAIRYVAKIFSTTSKKVGEALETNI